MVVRENHGSSVAVHEDAERARGDQIVADADATRRRPHTFLAVKVRRLLGSKGVEAPRLDDVRAHAVERLRDDITTPQFVLGPFRLDEDDDARLARLPAGGHLMSDRDADDVRAAEE